MDDFNLDYNIEHELKNQCPVVDIPDEDDGALCATVENYVYQPLQDKCVTKICIL